MYKYLTMADCLKHTSKSIHRFVYYFSFLGHFLCFVMLFYMNLKQILPKIGLIAEQALVRLDVLMPPFVIGCVAARREGLWAELALKGLRARVRAHVHVQVGLVVEDLVAPWHLAVVLFPALLGGHV